MSTKDKILDAAERLFARDGFDGTSLRSITTEADVNLAAVNYHFKSKEALILELFARHLKPVAEQREALLAEYLAGAGDGPLELESILTAFFRPVLHAGSRERSENGMAVKCLLGRLYTSPQEFMSKLFDENFRATVSMFQAAITRAIPHLSAEDTMWRMHFMIGSMAHTLAAGELLKLLSGGRCNTQDLAQVERQMVAFAAAGLRAEVPKA